MAVGVAPVIALDIDFAQKVPQVILIKYFWENMMLSDKVLSKSYVWSYVKTP